MRLRTTTNMYTHVQQHHPVHWVQTLVFLYYKQAHFTIINDACRDMPGSEWIQEVTKYITYAW